MSRELDAEVARRVMGMEVTWLLPDRDGVQPLCLAEGVECDYGIMLHDPIKNYSSDISAAAEVVEHLGRAGLKVYLSAEGRLAVCRIMPSRLDSAAGVIRSNEWGEGEEWKRSFGEALALSICEAAVELPKVQHETDTSGRSVADEQRSGVLLEG